MGYDYTIHYRTSKTNTVADVLSRILEEGHASLLVLSVPHFAFLDQLKRELTFHPEFIALKQALQDNPTIKPDYVVVQNFILYKNSIWLPSRLDFIHTLLLEFHTTPTGGHMGIKKILAHLVENFTLSSMRDDVRKIIASCRDCQHTKYEARKSASLLCPLPMPLRPWEDLLLDFIVGLPPYRGHTTILVVVDRFSKGVHLGMLTPNYMAHTVALLFLEIVGKPHGMPRSLVSDRDPLFISRFWQELFRLSGT